jgi:archaellum component FlaC
LKFKINKIKDPSTKQQMLQLTNDMDSVSEKLDKSSSEFVATIDGVTVDVETADAEKLNEMKSAQDVSNHVRKTIQGMASVMNDLAETEATIDESFDTVKKASAEREETMQWLREQMSATKKEVEAVTRKDFDDADALMKTIDKRIKEHNEKVTKSKEPGNKTFEPTRYEPKRYEPKRFEVNKFEPTKF